jgi:hypothetical protein
MKKIIFAVFAMLAWVPVLQAQQRNCGTMEYLEIRKKANPELEKKMADDEQKMREWISSHPVNQASVVALPVLEGFTPSGNPETDRINYANAKATWANAQAKNSQAGSTDDAKTAALRKEKRKKNSFTSK